MPMNQASQEGRRVVWDPKDRGTPDSNPLRTDQIDLDPVIGFPPLADYSAMRNLQFNAIPLVIITPCEPEFQPGMTLFNLKHVEDKYKKMVQEFGYNVTVPLTIAFIPDVPVSENITNEYGESFLNRMTDVVSSGFSEMNQILGGKSAIETSEKLAEVGQRVGGLAGGGIGLGAAAGKKAAETIRQFGNAISPGAGELANKLLAGGRIDFPFIWKNSAHTVTASITVRLYNPQPGNDTMHNKYIVGPLVALLTLATPSSDHMNVYSWPFLHKIKCAGLFNIDPGTINSVSVTRGAENQVSFGQRPSLVDVRLDFGSLYSVMLNSKDPATRNRPSIIQLRDSLLQKRKLKNIYIKPPIITISSVQIESEVEKNLEVETTRNISTPTSAEVDLNSISDRSSPENVAKAAWLRVATVQSGFYE